MPTILIADDELSIRTILSKALKGKGFDVIKAEEGVQALGFLKSQPIDVAIIDIRMPGKTGLEILNAKGDFPSQPAIFIMTAQDTMENAIEAMKRGAFDYITKPFDIEEVFLLVDRALETRELKSTVEILKRQGKPTPGTLIGKSKSIRDIHKMIGRVANQDVTVLIQGESGTGKELVAQAIHHSGNRAAKPFVAVNCSAIPANLLESELFGAKKGAYTDATSDKTGFFEQANGGTLFLDEIGDMPFGLQSKLLRVLQEKEVQRLGEAKTISLDVRVIAASNQDLAAKVKNKEFREDLFFRLNVVPIELPPLRERKNDIPLLVEHFMNQNAEHFGGAPKKLSTSALEILVNRNWPGNVRELENFLKRVTVLTTAGTLEAIHLKALDQGSPITSFKEIAPDQLEPLISESLQKMLGEKPHALSDRFLPLMERPLIRQALAKAKENQIQAAKILGINRNTLRKKIKELKIDRRKK